MIKENHVQEWEYFPEYALVYLFFHFITLTLVNSFWDFEKVEASPKLSKDDAKFEKQYPNNSNQTIC